MSNAGTRDPLLEGLMLPDGTRLTKVRRELLEKIGQALLDGNRIYIYSYHTQAPRLLLRKLNGLHLSGNLCAAFRELVKQKVITLGPDVSSSTSYWHEHDVIFQEPWGAIAKRLASQQALDKQQKVVDSTARDAAYQALSDLRDEWVIAGNDAVYKGIFPSTSEVLALAGKISKALAAHQREEAAYAAEQARLAALPKPTPEEALTWLVSQQLKAK